ncbi:MAG: malto-oligosyltrehalose trehalohydrolase, partial [Blastocatellia bacterium]|nr:malto-oligosyltrehalose trehalohydrolase [Blastocatellia bacterium]
MNIGAEVLRGGGVRFRVWAPRRSRVEVVIGERNGEGVGYELTREANDESPGYFSGNIDRAGDGTLYWYRLDDGESLYPDPASRFQPDGPHGPSQVIDPGRFAWTDWGWRGLKLAGQIIYELHIGTFTREGTWEAAGRELGELADLGVTVLNVMPVADFPGRFGWGYDGVNLFAPKRVYGEPDDFRRFVDQAHALGLAVILDVVYNHLGPDGNYLREFSESYFSNRHRTDWGEAINYDGEQSGPVRDYFLANAGYWVEEFHIDGLRLDATHSIYDDSQDNILGAIG